MTQRKLTDDEKQELRDAFRDVDTDGSGKIERRKLRMVLQLIGQNPTLDEARACQPNVTDEDQFNCDELCDFVENNVTLKTRGEIDEDIAGALAKFGEKGDVSMDKKELVNILTTLGQEPLTDQEVTTVLEGVKAREDGRIDITELAAHLKK